jgi:hypothetical protein
VVTVSGRPVGRPIPAGFLGLSTEYTAVEAYAGVDPAAIDPVFVQLVRNLAPGQAPVVRIGGDSADRTWWPAPGIARPPGVRHALTPRLLAVVRTLAGALGARLILGLDMEAGDPALAAAEADALIAGIGRASIAAFEVGNEPELYPKFPWYRSAAGRPVAGRPPSYGFVAFLRDYARFAAALPGDVLAGPSFGGPGWMRGLPAVLETDPAVRIATVHEYPEQSCFTPAGSAHAPSLAALLSPAGSRTFADGFRGAVLAAHALGRTIRIDELNTVSCGAIPAISQTFATALWSLDTLFELARIGADGVNIHTFPGAGYNLFRTRLTVAGWRATVAPQYYGLLMFADAAPPGSRLLEVAGSAGPALAVWGTRAPDGTVRVVAVNEAASEAQSFTLAVPGATAAATVLRLTAPSAAARVGVALGGRSFGTTSTGTLPAPLQTTAVAVAGEQLHLEMPPASAALLTLRLGASRTRTNA